MKIKHILSLLILSLSGAAISQDIKLVSFPSADGGTVYADYYPSGPHAVVLAHGAVFNKKSWTHLAKQLKEHDLSVLAIDFRGYGRSTAGNRPADRYEDILAAVRFLHQQAHIHTVSLLGASMGGGASANALLHAKTGEINKLVLLSSVPIQHPEKLHGDILYIASKKEGMINIIRAQYQRTPNPKQFKLIEGNAHAQHIFKTTENDKLTRLIIGFLTGTSS